MSDFQREYVRFMIDRIREQLSPLGVSATERKPMYWLHGDEVDESLNYCDDCINTALVEARKSDPDAGICHGYGTSEEDGPSFCEMCGARLAHALTDYGAKSELEHFESVIKEAKSINDLSADEAECICDALSNATCWLPGSRRYQQLASFIKACIPLVDQASAHHQAAETKPRSASRQGM